MISGAILLSPPLFADELDDAIAAMKSEDCLAMQAACKTLGDIGGPKAQSALTSAFRDQMGMVQDDAADALARIGGAAIEKLFIDSLQSDSFGTTRAAIRGLGAMKSRKAVKPLIAALKKGFSFRDEAARSLGLIGDPAAVDALMAAIPTARTEQPDPSGLEEICHALAVLGQPRAAKSLAPLLRDQEWRVRSSAWTALKTLDWSPSTDGEKLSAALAQGDWDALSAAGEKALPVLLVALDEEGSVESAQKLIAGLGSVALPPLVASMKDVRPDSDRARGVAGTFEAIGDPGVEPLLAALKSANSSTRSIAVMALGDLKVERAAPAIARFIAVERSEDATFIGLTALRKIGEPGRTPVLGLLEGKNEAARIWLAFTAGGLGPEVAPRIAEIGRASRDKDVRGSCAWALEIVDTDSSRAASAELLGTDPEQAAGDYEKLLKDPAKNAWLLIAAMQRAGGQDMVNRFLNSSNAKIAQAAGLWARDHGYKIMMLPGG
jgi:HEAT repeat protein